jgi:four helix bundle protein
MSYKYRELIAWQKAKKLAVEVCILVRRFPKDELYGLTSQLRRSAISVPSNIAEGQGRLSRGEFLQFLGHARGSLFEVQTQLEIALDLGYMAKEDFDRLEGLSNDVRALLNRLIESLQPKSKSANA